MVSFAELVILFVIVVGVWRWFAWRERRKSPRQPPQDDKRGSLSVEDLIFCPRGGTYVSAQQTRSCSREECPYRMR